MIGTISKLLDLKVIIFNAICCRRYGNWTCQTYSIILVPWEWPTIFNILFKPNILLIVVVVIQCTSSISIQKRYIIIRSWWMLRECWSSGWWRTDVVCSCILNICTACWCWTIFISGMRWICHIKNISKHTVF